MKFNWTIPAALAMAMALPVVASAQDTAAANAITHVFFDWGKVEISQDAAAALDALALQLGKAGSATVAVIGHSDRSGPAAANRLSALHRAEAVRDYLIGRGVPRSLLNVGTRGEDDPLIATADGVREPQNRRVDVTLSQPN